MLFLAFPRGVILWWKKKKRNPMPDESGPASQHVKKGEKKNGGEGRCAIINNSKLYGTEETEQH